jgi:hypothetical protein
MNMNPAYQKSRVYVDFPEPERDVLQILCDADLRLPAEQLRWLVLTEAQRRGLISKNSNTATKVYETTSGGVAGVNPEVAKRPERIV